MKYAVRSNEASLNKKVSQKTGGIFMFKTYIISGDLNENKARTLLRGHSQVIYSPSLTEDDIIKNCSDADALISLYEPVTAKVIDALSNLKFISVAAIGFNNIDVNYAKNRGIHVSNNPNYCIEEVADHTSALILSLSRKLFQYNKAVHEYKIWKFNAAGGDIYRLSHLSVGLFGFGNISKKVAQRLQAFGCSIIAYDPFISKEAGGEYGVKLVSLDEILKSSDIISVHMPLNKSTLGFFNEEIFSRMERKPIFINCSRGGLVNEKALLNALDVGLVSAAGLDVLESEIPDLDNCDFIGRDNVILTPHAAFYSQQSVAENLTLAVEHVKYFIKGQLDKIPLVV